MVENFKCMKLHFSVRCQMTKPEQFKEELVALMAKYKVEMRVKESWRGYVMSVDGINFEFDGEMIDDVWVDYPDLLII